MPDSPFDFKEEQSLTDNRQTGQPQAYPRSMIAGVIVLCALIGVLVYWQMQYNLALEIPLFGEGEMAFEQIQQGLLEMSDEQLKLQDSDRDGLTDFEELRVYGSSPYIADTDSDGITDFDEVRQGGDPNCPQGENCFSPQTYEGERQQSDYSFESEEIQQLADDPQQLRLLLIQQGLSADIVNQMDDQSLQILAQEALSSLTEPSLENFEELENITVEQLRTLLIQSGVNQEELEVFSDEQLQQLYSQLLSQTRQELAEGAE